MLTNFTYVTLENVRRTSITMNFQVGKIILGLLDLSFSAALKKCKKKSVPKV